MKLLINSHEISAKTVTISKTSTTTNCRIISFEVNSFQIGSTVEFFDPDDVIVFTGTITKIEAQYSEGQVPEVIVICEIQ